ncbi:MAG TPA: archaeosortase/exosortase family protein [Allosphingosinicella sp.]|jgi:exosortase/archaeosortase family protein|nr:archaeosortase/exosortase family protein [Allosphingosinicella sp.]
MAPGLDPRLALAVTPLLFWDAWRLLAGRFGDGLSAVPLALVGLAVAAPAVRRIAAGEARPVPLRWLSFALAGYVAATLAGPALPGAAVAVVAVALLCRHVAAGALPWPPLVGLALLALPVLPSLDFYLAYPMRLAGSALAAAMLRLNGMAVGVEGVALSWNGSLLLFDGACSGVRMLWAALFLVSAVALAAGFGFCRYAGAIGIAAAIAIAGNAIRASSLFYLENGLAGPLRGPVAHEAVGLVSFLMLALATLFCVAPRRT